MTEPCTIACEAMPECVVCGRRKSPRGRDVAAAAAGSYCEHECEGYGQPPEPGHLWPGELERIRESEAQP